MSSPLQKASELGNLLAQLPLRVSQDEPWTKIELTAQSLANDLRVKNVDQQSALGKTLLPQTLSSLLQGATAGTVTPQPQYKPVILEILRVGANLCLDHDKNRASLLEAGFPQTVVSLLEGYADAVQLNDTGPMNLSTADLQIVKTAIGVCLNISVDYEPAKTRLISLEAAMTIVKLSMAIYPPGSWLRETHVPIEGSDETAKVVESWVVRSTVSKWVWSTISEWEEDDDNDGPRQLFTADILPYLSRVLQAFVPPYPNPPPLFAAPQARHVLVKLDFESLEIATGQFERLALDVEEAKIALGRGYVESGSDSVLSRMLTFIEYGDYPPHWSTTPATPKSSSEEPKASVDESDARKKGFDRCKAAIAKAVVEVAGDDRNTNVLWDESQDKGDTPGGKFIATMVRWIREHKDPGEGQRDDLLVCALVTLGNLCRKDSHSTAFVSGYSLLPDLVSLLQASTDLKILHGLVGLLKHLATSPANRTPLGQAGVLGRLAASDIIHPRTDAVELLQTSAIGLVKHLCNNNVDNSFVVCLSPPSTPGITKTLLDHILDLGRRSDSTVIKSESTRVAVNIIKSLWTTDITSQENLSTFEQKRDAARKALVSTHCAAALAQLIGRSRKYPMLINEGVVALTLLSTGHNGGSIALDALMNPLPVELGPHRQASLPMSAGGMLIGSMSVDGSPATATPRCALDMLVSFLHDVPIIFQQNARSPSTSLPVEVRANICALVGHLGRKGVVIDRERDVQVLKENTRRLLETLAENSGSEGNTNRSAAAARKALDAWARE